MSSSSSSASVSVKFSGWWGDQSALLSAECGLYKLKMAFIEALIKNKSIKDTDIDDRNRKPHIKLRDSNSDHMGMFYFDKLHNSQIDLNVYSFRIRTSFVDVDVGNHLHCTLLYKKNAFVQEASNEAARQNFRRLIIDPLLAQFPHPVVADKKKEDEEEVKKDESKICIICMDKAKNVLIEPCNHLCVCTQCVAQIARCPICRVPITAHRVVYDS